jgi:hypothetical protein
MYCMFFERYGDVEVPAVLRVPEVPSTVKLLAYSSTGSRLIDFDRRFITANQKFIRDFVMVNMFYIHCCRSRKNYNRVVHPSVQLCPLLPGAPFCTHHQK